MRWKTVDNPPTDKPERPERPFGVTFFSIWDGLTIGLFPILMTTVSITTGGEETNFGLLTCLSLALSAGILFSAIGTWRGHDGSRLGLVLLVILYYSIRSFNDITALASGVLNPESRLDAYGRLLRYVIISGINSWYFLRPKTIAFYRYPKGYGGSQR
jgi:hypothetical protein